MSFWDSSALVPLLRAEPRSAVLRALYQDDESPAVWWGARLECSAALARLIRERRLGELEATRIRGYLDELVDATDEVEPGSAVRDRAEALLFTHPLRAADALQLAAALIWARDRPARSGFVCLDEQLRRAAGSVGFRVLPASR